MVLLVLVNKIVNNLGTTVRQLHTVLALYIVSVPGLGSGVHIRVTVLVISVHIVTKLVVFRSFLMVRSRGRVIRSRGWVIRGRSWVIRGRRGIRVTSIGCCRKGTD